MGYLNNLKSSKEENKNKPVVRKFWRCKWTLKNGFIDCIATDHAPHSIQDKEKDFRNASCGMIGLESCFGVINKVLVKDEGMDLEPVISLLTKKPRQIFGFYADLFSVGTEAELTVIDPEKEWIQSNEEKHLITATNQPIKNQKICGKVIDCGLINQAYQND